MKILEKVLVAAAACVFAGSLLACNQQTVTTDQTNYSTATVSGIVTECVIAPATGESGETGTAQTKGVAGATVTMGEYSAVTNTVGAWSISGVKPGDYEALVTKDGYSAYKIAKITVNGKEYEDEKYATSTALKEELLETIKALGIDTQATTGTTTGALGGTVETETANSATTSTTTAGYTIDANLLSWFDTTVASYKYDYAIVAAPAVLIPYTAGIKGTLKFYTPAADGINPEYTTAAEGVTVTVYSSSSDTIYGTAKTNAKGEFQIDTGLPAYKSLSELKICINKESNDEYDYSEGEITNYNTLVLLPSEEVVDEESVAAETAEKTYKPYTELTVVITRKNNNRIFVTSTNVGKASAGNPITLNDVIKFTFNRAIEKAEFSLDSDDKFTVSYSDDKKTVILTPETKWSSTLTQVTITSILTSDNCDLSSLEQNVYEVNLDKDLKVVAASFYDPFDIGRIVTPEATEALTIEFDKDIDYVESLTFENNDSITAKNAVVDGKKVSISPVQTLAGKKFSDGEFEIKVVAIDGSIFETEAGSGINITFNAFKQKSVEIIEQSEISSARAINVTSTKALKIVFNKAVKSVGKVTYNGTELVTKTGKTEIDDDTVFVLFDDTVNTEAAAALAGGTVTSVYGDTIEISDIVEDEFQAETSYSVVSANWGGKGSSVNGMNSNDSEVAEKLPVDLDLVITFNMDFAADSKAVAEIYEGSNEGSVTSKSYANTATVSGAAVTINPTVNLKADTTYYIALSVYVNDEDGTKTTEFTTKRTINVASDYSGIVDGNYFKVTTKGFTSVDNGVNSATTKYAVGRTNLDADVASIVVQYKDSIEGYKVLVTSQDVGTESYSEAVDTEKANVIAASHSISDNVLTVTPAGVLAIAKVYITIYDASGAKVYTTSYDIDYDTTPAYATKLIKAAQKSGNNKFNLELKTSASDIDSTNDPIDFTVTSLNKSGVVYKLYRNFADETGTYASVYTDATYSPVTISTIDVRREITKFDIKGTKSAKDFEFGNVKYVAYAEKDGIVYVSDDLVISDGKAPSINYVGPSAYNSFKHSYISGNEKTYYAKSSAILSSDILINANEIIVKAVASCSRTSVSVSTSYVDETTVKLSVSGWYLANDDKITVVLTDDSSNSTPNTTTVTIIVDDSLPEITNWSSFSNSTETIIYKNTSGWNTAVSNVSNKLNVSEELYTVSGESIYNYCDSVNKVVYLNNLSDYSDKTYTLTLTDLAGNTKMYTIIIDNTAPVASYNTSAIKAGDFGTENESVAISYNEDVTVEIESVNKNSSTSMTAATVSYVNKIASVVVTGNPVEEGDTIVVKATDKAQNVTRTTITVVAAE